MADEDDDSTVTVRTGASREVAPKLFSLAAHAEGTPLAANAAGRPDLDRRDGLDRDAECLRATRGERGVSRVG